ncbi:hypothetical protein SOVF_054260 [Spinacia oleracea]|nr:hypothetical protein SOVF_054260 [Spinacia oleracea]
MSSFIQYINGCQVKVEANERRRYRDAGYLVDYSSP